MNHWPVVPLSEVMEPHIDSVESCSLSTVNLAGVYGFGRGLFKRGQICPLDTTYKVFHKLHAGDVVISTPKAWEGAIARIPREFEGWFLSPVFPTFRGDSDRLDTRFLEWYCKRATVWEELRFKAKGIGARRESVTASQFLSLEIPLPPLDVQRSIVTRLDTVAEKARQVAARLDGIEADAERLLAIRFRQVIAGADWRPMSEVAPVVRRSVELSIDRRYREVGARSFGKGLFIKPDFVGADATWQKPVWIESGVIVISNIKAWEGAIAVARLEHAGCIASHRYLTCEPAPDRITADFLCYYLLSSEGLDQVGLASPGTADRNRTLSQTSLGNIRVPVPQLDHQHTFNTLHSKVAAMKAKHTAIRKDLDALLPSMLERVFHSERCSP